MKEALEATFPQLSRLFFHMNAGRDEPGTTTPPGREFSSSGPLHIHTLDLWYSSAIQRFRRQSATRRLMAIDDG